MYKKCKLDRFLDKFVFFFMKKKRKYQICGVYIIVGGDKLYGYYRKVFTL